MRYDVQTDPAVLLFNRASVAAEPISAAFDRLNIELPAFIASTQSAAISQAVGEYFQANESSISSIGVRMQAGFDGANAGLAAYFQGDLTMAEVTASASQVAVDTMGALQLAPEDAV